MRALAKDPDDRYQNAEEMDADLERFLRGAAAVSPVTEESATQIMRAPSGPMSATAATMIVPPRRGATMPPPPPPVYYDLEEPMRRRPVWPWIAALLFVVAAGIGGWFLYTQISNKINSTKPIAVGFYLNQTERSRARTSRPTASRRSSTITRRGRPTAGSSTTRIRSPASGSRRGAP